MAATQLTQAAPISGSFSVSGVSAPFQAPFPGPGPFYGQILPTFSLQATFSNGTVGTLTVTKSVDGGSTFSPIKAGQQIISSLPASGSLNFQQLNPSWIYRLECSLTSGSVSYSLSRNFSTTSAVGMIEPQVTNDAGNVGANGAPVAACCTYLGLAISGAGGYHLSDNPPSQIQKLYETIWTPVQDADIAGAFTAYKTLWQPGTAPIQNVFAKLSVSSAAGRGRGLCCRPGERREIRVSTATITSLVNASGTAVASAYLPYGDPAATLGVGSAITDASYQDGDVRTGVVVFLTLMEAINYQLQQAPANGVYPSLPNLTALSA